MLDVLILLPDELDFGLTGVPNRAFSNKPWDDNLFISIIDNGLEKFCAAVDPIGGCVERFCTRGVAGGAVSVP